MNRNWLIFLLSVIIIDYSKARQIYRRDVCQVRVKNSGLYTLEVKWQQANGTERIDRILTTQSKEFDPVEESELQLHAVTGSSTTISLPSSCPSSGDERVEVRCSGTTWLGFKCELNDAVSPAQSAEEEDVSGESRPVVCPSLAGTVTYGQYHYNPPSPSSIIPGTTAILSCSIGYKPSDVSRLTCTSNGSWDKPVGNCYLCQVEVKNSGAYVLEVKFDDTNDDEKLIQLLPTESQIIHPMHGSELRLHAVVGGSTTLMLPQTCPSANESTKVKCGGTTLIGFKCEFVKTFEDEVADEESEEDF